LARVHKLTIFNCQEVFAQFDNYIQS